MTAVSLLPVLVVALGAVPLSLALGALSVERRRLRAAVRSMGDVRAALGESADEIAALRMRAASLRSSHR